MQEDPPQHWGGVHPPSQGHHVGAAGSAILLERPAQRCLPMCKCKKPFDIGESNNVCYSNPGLHQHLHYQFYMGFFHFDLA